MEKREKFNGGKFVQYWVKESFEKKDVIPVRFRGMKHHTILVFSALLGTMAALFQSAGGFLLGIGYFISPLATAPIILSTVFSARYGLMAYSITIALLAIIQPSELFVFPFTTGLLGLAIGVGLRLFKRRISIVSFGAFALLSGILTLLYVFQFPILGPVVSQSLSIIAIMGIYLFSFIYSIFWIEVYLYVSRRFL
jgi:membrane-associated HD superfamily phosphohydrolase